MSFEAGTYKLTGCPKGGSSTTYRIGMNLNGDSFDTGNGATKTITTAVFNKNVWLIVYKGTTVNNLTFYPMLIKSTEDKPYEQYGASPSIDYPSEIKTVKDSVQVNVSNSNMLDFNVAQDKKVTVNDDGTITINGTGGFFLNFKEISLKKGITYYTNYQVISGTAINSKEEGKIFLKLRNTQGKYLQENSFNEDIYQDDITTSVLWIHANAVFTNAKIKIWTSTEKSDFVPHQYKSVIMPIQQEMLSGDYIKDVEHHEWGKLILNGEENWIYDSNYKYFRCPSYTFDRGIPDGSKKGLEAQKSNYFEITSDWGTTFRDNINKNIMFGVSDAGYKICIRNVNCATIEEFKAWLKSKYDAGTPVVVYYKLATPVDLELTPEQKTVRNQKLYTYKNITNISLSDELASIDVTYKKDLETMFNNIIKQIPSSTSDTTET